ncbi:hypothetical protein DUG15_27375 [Salmonella enterica]|nr:hypothetical protein [Salmonella enterica]
MANLQELYSGEDLEIVTTDFEHLVSLLKLWLEGGDIDPELAHYSAMSLFTLYNDASALDPE